MGTRSKANQPADYVPPTPLLGFGWIGWVLLAAAIGLLLVLLLDIDARYYLFRAIMFVVGVDAFMRFVAQFTMYGILVDTLPTTCFGPVGLCVVLLGMGVHPRRFRWWHYVMLAGVTVVIIPFLPIWMSKLGQPDSWWQDFGVRFTIAEVLRLLVALATLAIITRSRLIVLASLVVLSAPTGVQILSALYFDQDYSAPDNLVRQRFSLASINSMSRIVGWTWWPALLAVLLSWAIAARRAWPARHGCPSCGYDLSAVSLSVCPECGASREAVNRGES